jgi:hypothetical protein
VPAGRIAQAPVINTGWVPTLLELAHAPVSADATLRERLREWRRQMNAVLQTVR